MRPRGLFTFSGQPRKNGKQVAKLLDGTQHLKQWAIIEILGLSNAAGIEARGNDLADAAARRAALHSQVVQT